MTSVVLRGDGRDERVEVHYFERHKNTIWFLILICINCHIIRKEITSLFKMQITS